MRKIRFLAVLLVIAVLAGAAGLTAMAADNKINVILHIVGVEDSILFDETLTVSFEGDSITVLQLLETVNELNPELGIVAVDSTYGAYVSEISGLTEMAFGGMSGWNYLVNAVSPSVGMSAYELSDGDEIILYYADPFGVGFQIPIVNVTGGGKGAPDEYFVTFTSEDTVYDENWNPTVEVNPIVGASVTWDDEIFITDEDGKIRVPNLGSLSGFHSLQIERYDEETGLPTVLRYPHGYGMFVLYIDTAQDAWYTEAVEYSVRSGFFKGYDNNIFSPENTMTMAELVTVLSRIADADTTALQGEQWYSGALSWAIDEGIIHDAQYDPTANVTREIFIHMFYQTAELVGEYDMTLAADITGAEDFADIDESFIDAISWAVESGIIMGTSEDTLVIDPGADISRADVCQMLMNYYK